MAYLAPKLPFSPSSRYPGGLEMIERYDVLVRQNLKNLLLTNPGERVMDPDFGVGLSTFLFQPNNGVTYEAISSRVSGQVRRYMPFVEITNIEFNRKDNENNLDIEGNYVDLFIQYIIKPLSLNGSMNLTNTLILTEDA